MHSQEAELFIKVIIMHVNIKLLDLLTCFHSIMNPSYVRFKKAFCLLSLRKVHAYRQQKVFRTFCVITIMLSTQK